MVEHPAKDRLQAGRDNVEGDVVVEAEFVEDLEIKVEREGFLDRFEAGIEGKVE